MATCTGYVIVALAAVVCLVSAWPQHRSTLATNFNDEEYDRVIWGSEDSPNTKRVPTPANSPRQSVTKPTTRRSQRLQTGIQLELDNDTTPQQQQQPQHRGKTRGAQMNHEGGSNLERHRSNNATSRGIQSEQVVARQPNRTTQRAVSSRGASSQDVVRPSFQPRAHQSPVNHTRQAMEGRGNGGAMEERENGGSGGRTTTTPRGAVNNVTMEGEGFRETVLEGRGLPEVRDNGSRDDFEMAASQDAGARSRHVDHLAAERNLPRWESNKGTRVKLPSENIVFPGPSHDDKHTGGYNRHFMPPVVDKRPRCAKTSTFCEEVVNDYPRDHLNRILEQQSVVFRNFFATDVVPEANNNISTRIDDAQEDTPICVSETHVVFPKVAQNKDNDWLYVVNLDDEMYKQGVRIEKCRSPDQPCAYSEGFPQSIQTFCKQKYIYRQMLAVTQDGTPKPDSFKLPSCCACHTMSMGDVVSRMGMNPNRQSPVPTRTKRRS